MFYSNNTDLNSSKRKSKSTWNEKENKAENKNWCSLVKANSIFFFIKIIEKNEKSIGKKLALKNKSFRNGKIWPSLANTGLRIYWSSLYGEY